MGKYALWLAIVLCATASVYAAVFSAGAADNEAPVLRLGELIRGEITDADPVVDSPGLSLRNASAPVVCTSFAVGFAKAGTFALELRSDVFDAYLIVRDRNGNIVAEDDDGLAGTNAKIMLDGRPGLGLRIDVCALDGDRGAFDLILREHEARPLNERTALQTLEYALAQYEQTVGPDHLTVGLTLNGIGAIALESGDYARARTVFERVVGILEAQLDPADDRIAVTHGNVAAAAQLEGDFVAALAHCQRALAHREQHLDADDPRIALSLLDLSVVFSDLGRVDDAYATARRALELQERVLEPHDADLAHGLGIVAAMEFDRGEYEVARRLLERCLAFHTSTRGADDLDLAAASNKLALVFQAQGDAAAARPHAERALAIAEAARGPDHLLVAVYLANLAMLLERQGDPASALPLAERSLAIRETKYASNALTVANGIHTLGFVLHALGESERALDCFERELALQEQARGPDHPIVAQCLSNVAALRRTRGDIGPARALAERSLAIRERALSADHPEVANSLMRLAALDVDAGDLAAARARLERALEILERIHPPEQPDRADAEDAYCRVLVDLGDVAAAAERLDRGIGAQRARIASTMAHASEADARNALATFEQRMLLAQSPCVLDGRLVSAYESVLAWKGQLLRATRAARERARRAADPATEALSARLRAVNADLSRSATDIARTRTMSDADRIQQLCDERGRLERELAAATASTVSAPPTWREVRAALDERTALVDFFVHRVYVPARREGTTVTAAGGYGERRVTAWITRSDRDEPIRVDLGPAAAIEAALIVPLTTIVGGRGHAVASSPTSDSAGGQARRLIWDPVAEHLVGIEVVIASPDGSLAGFPLEILKAADGRYLVESRGFVYATDPTQIVDASRSRPITANGFICVGGVDYAGEGGSGPVRGGQARRWEPLDATEDEIDAIEAMHAQAFPDETRTRLTGSAATEARLKHELARHAVLHLATHAYFDDTALQSLGDAERQDAERRRDDPARAFASSRDLVRRLENHLPGLLAGLVCAGANLAASADGEDAYLTAEEVGWIDLSNADLVVLSACDTALGRPQAGEGMLGLRRAFLTAGARTVVSSLWSVPDQETAEFMGRFYRNLWQRKMGKHDALRAAQLETIAANRAAHDGNARPWTWGAFVLDGDWR